MTLYYQPGYPTPRSFLVAGPRRVPEDFRVLTVGGLTLRQRRPVVGAAAAVESGPRSAMELVLVPGCWVLVLLVPVPS